MDREEGKSAIAVDVVALTLTIIVHYLSNPAWVQGFIFVPYT